MDGISSKYHVDIVFCIDMTGNVSAIEDVRSGLRGFKQSFCDPTLLHNFHKVAALRVRFILFKDYSFDKEPMLESRFFTLDDELDEALAFLDGRYPSGGGDLHENALEALALAMKSDWVEKELSRHIIILATDAPAKPLGEPTDCAGYPENMPKSFDELHKIWENEMKRKAKRLFVFAPEAEPWCNLVDWTNTFHTVVKDNLYDVDIMKALIDFSRCFSVI
ncbi:MAG: VWA domain-containing protein [Clostridia bacterium]|nr:VWA domain-containing protein [Clostridia bacterium]